MKTCLFCGASFVPGKGQKYCNKQCAIYSWRVRQGLDSKERIATRLSEGKCEQCGKVTPPGLKRPRRFCSVDCKNASYRVKYADRSRAGMLQRRYSITTAHYERMFAAQKGKCNICGKSPSTQRLAVDHDHESGLVRGLLCFKCNTSLGWYEKHKDGVRKHLGW